VPGSRRAIDDYLNDYAAKAGFLGNAGHTIHETGDMNLAGMIRLPYVGVKGQDAAAERRLVIELERAALGRGGTVGAPGPLKTRSVPMARG